MARDRFTFAGSPTRRSLWRSSATLSAHLAASFPNQSTSWNTIIIPFGSHQHAQEAAFASEAAGLQGRFWEMHDLLYREQAAWSTAADARLLFNAYAGMLGLKIDRFKKDMESDEVKRRVTSDQQQGAALGVTVTPTIFINNRALPPASLNAAGLRAAIAAAIKAKSPP